MKGRQSRCFTLPVMVLLITITDAAMTLTVSIYPVTVLKQPVIVLKQPVIVLELTITDTWMDPQCDYSSYHCDDMLDGAESL